MLRYALRALNPSAARDWASPTIAVRQLPALPPVRIQVEPLDLYSFFMLFGGKSKFYNVIERLVDNYTKPIRMRKS